MDNPTQPQPQPAPQPVPPFQQPITPAATQPSFFQRIPRWVWVLVVVGALVVACGGCGGVLALSSLLTNNTTAQSPQATATLSIGQPPAAPKATATPKPKPTATHAPSWTTFQKWSGNGSKTTDTFSAPDTWKILWTCTPSSFYGNYDLSVTVYGSDGSIVDFPVSVTCKSGYTTDSSVEHSGSGTYYLEIASEGDWTIQLQEMK